MRLPVWQHAVDFTLDEDVWQINFLGGGRATSLAWQRPVARENRDSATDGEYPSRIYNSLLARRCQAQLYRLASSKNIFCSYAIEKFNMI